MIVPINVGHGLLDDEVLILKREQTGERVMMRRPAQGPLCWVFPTAMRVHHWFISYYAPCRHTVNSSEGRECAFIKSVSWYQLTPAFHNSQMKKRRMWLLRALTVQARSALQKQRDRISHLENCQALSLPKTKTKTKTRPHLETCSPCGGEGWRKYR